MNTEVNYVVKSGDCLWTIAENILKNPKRWPEIYNDNKDIIGNNPDLIYPGQQLTIKIS